MKFSVRSIMIAMVPVALVLCLLAPFFRGVLSKFRTRVLIRNSNVVVCFNDAGYADTVVFFSESREEDMELLKYGGFSRIKRLVLSGTCVSNEDLLRLSAFSGLEWLALDGTEIGDEGIEHLDQLHRLRYLYLSDTSITDASVQVLTNIKTLEWLDITGTDLSVDEVERLRRSLRQTKINFWQWTGIRGHVTRPG